MRVTLGSVAASMAPMPVRQVQLALVLANSGTRFVIVGSTARYLRDGAAPRPKDLGPVVSRSDAPRFTFLLSSVAEVGGFFANSRTINSCKT